ncbi:reverse transcriptase [Phytophthora palmivora]|uniref:Reverse transcriptase n=1 Tax=Phytophthora palmivora TaxID=4796 RepID=A0A2P4XAY5_9STRA|nr:reverse transcriptase [Phytophthora palmivora]
MRPNKLYTNIDKCAFAAEEIKAFDCYVNMIDVRPIQGRSNALWLANPKVTEDLRKWLSLAIYLRKYSAGYAELAIPFITANLDLQHAPVLALPDENKPFSVVCDASDYAIGRAQLQKDDEGRDRIISFRSRRLKAAERNYPVHDKELLAMNYALVMFRNFRVEYKPGKLNVLADALSHRLDYELAHVSQVTTDLYDRIRLAYQVDENYTPLVRLLSKGTDAKIDRLSPRQRAQLHRYDLTDGLLHYRADPGDSPRVVVPTTRI